MGCSVSGLLLRESARPAALVVAVDQVRLAGLDRGAAGERLAAVVVERGVERLVELEGLLQVHRRRDHGGDAGVQGLQQQLLAVVEAETVVVDVRTGVVHADHGRDLALADAEGPLHVGADALQAKAGALLDADGAVLVDDGVGDRALGAGSRGAADGLADEALGARAEAMQDELFALAGIPRANHLETVVTHSDRCLSAPRGSCGYAVVQTRTSRRKWEMSPSTLLGSMVPLNQKLASPAIPHAVPL